MRTDSQFDDFFRSRLQNYRADVPAYLWDRIVEKKDRNRKLFFFILLTGLFIAGPATIAYIAVTGKTTSISVNKDRTAPISGTKLQSPLHPLTPTGQQFSPSSPGIKADQSNKTGTETAGCVSKIHVKKRHSNFNSLESGNYKNIASVKRYSRSIPPAFMEGEKSGVTRRSKSPKSVDADYSRLSDKGRPIEIGHLFSGKAADSIPSISFQLQRFRDSAGRQQSKEPSKQKVVRKGEWFIDLFGSPDYPIISPRAGEHAALSYMVGARAGRRFGKHFSVKTGVEFSKINMHGNDSLANGHALHLVQWNIPALINYSVSSQIATTTFTAGAILNLHSRLHGTTLSDVFRSNTGIGLYFGVGLEKKIHKSVSLFCEPHYTYQLTSMTINSFHDMKFIDVIGVNLGVRFHFKK